MDVVSFRLTTDRNTQVVARQSTNPAPVKVCQGVESNEKVIFSRLIVTENISTNELGLKFMWYIW